LRTGCILVTYSYVNFSPSHRSTIIGNQPERVLSENYSDGFATLAGENRPSHVKPVMLFRHSWQISPILLAVRVFFGRGATVEAHGTCWFGHHQSPGHDYSQNGLHRLPGKVRQLRYPAVTQLSALESLWQGY